MIGLVSDPFQGGWNRRAGENPTCLVPQEGTASSFSGLAADSAACSPQARGRCERASRTPRERLRKELALAGIRTVEAANRSPREICLQEHNERLATAPVKPGSALVQVREALWHDVACVRKKRRVGDDDGLRWQGRISPIPPTPLWPHFLRPPAGTPVCPGGGIALLKGPQRPAGFPRRLSAALGTGLRDAATPPAGGSADQTPPPCQAPLALHQQRPHHALPTTDSGRYTSLEGGAEYV